MLWEPLEPERVVKQRFGHSGAAAAGEWVTESLSEHWGLRATCEDIVLSDVNLIAWVQSDAGPLVIKACVRQPVFQRLDAIAQAVARLGAADLPVAAPLVTAAGSHRAIVDGDRPASVMVMPRIEGEILNAASPAALRHAGEVLAAVHLALVSSDSVLPPPDSADRRRPRLVLPKDSVSCQRAPKATARLAALLTDLPILDTPVQLVHGDARGANVLCVGDQVRALIDYDEMYAGQRTSDLGNLIAMAATAFHYWGPPPPGTSAHVLAGYESVSPLSDAERAHLQAAVLAIALSQIPDGTDPHGWADAVEQGL